MINIKTFSFVRVRVRVRITKVRVTLSLDLTFVYFVLVVNIEVSAGYTPRFEALIVTGKLGTTVNFTPTVQYFL